MLWWIDFAEVMEHEVRLDRMTWFRLGGRARHMCRPVDTRQLIDLVVRANAEEVPVRVLGAGANVLVSDDGFDGVVVRLDSPAFTGVAWNDRGANVGAGADLMSFARECCNKGYSGLECMAGIPSTIGGAVKMNAGGPYGEFGQVVTQIDVLTPEGLRETWLQERIGFDYRRSRIEREMVLAARIELVEDDPVKVRNRYDDYFAAKTRSQPLKHNSAGCIFKNPQGRSAGALIDQAGLKGFSCGGASVSTDHANFIVAKEGARASHVLELIEVIRERIKRVFDIVLELEVEVW